MKKGILSVLAAVLSVVLMLAVFAACGKQGEQGPVGPTGDTGAQGEKGDTGTGVKSIVKTSTEGLVDTYTITFTDGTATTFTVTNGADGEQGIQGIQGVKGADGHTPVITIQNGCWYIDGVNTNQSATGIVGATGNGISSIVKTSTEGLVDTYTITYTDGATTTFTVTNGEQGIQGIQGEKGADGHSPVITIQNGYWYIDGVNTNQSATVGVKGDTGNGISSIAKTSTEGLVDTYTVTFTDGTTTTFTVTNGADGNDGANGTDGKNGEDGEDGKDGEDGQTPYIKDGYWWIGDTNTNVKAEGTDGVNGNDGKDGEDGEDGKDGEDGVSVTDAYVDENLHLWIVLSNGTKIDAGYVGVTTTDPAPEEPEPDEPEITEPTIIVSDVSASAGDTIEVAVSIKNNPGIAGAKLIVTYDSNLTLTSAVEGSAWEAIDYTAPPNLNSGCAFTWDSLVGEATEDGTVILLTFKVADNVSVGDILEITCSYVDGDIYDENLEDVSLDCINGSVTIE